MTKWFRDYILIVLSGMALLHLKDAGANPTNPTVISGSASFDTSIPQTLVITASDRTIISWEEFSIDAQETTIFILPDSGSTVLNQVSSLSSSTIDGLLSSNGNIYLINVNGMLVTPNGQINTAGLLASTLDTPDSGFLAGGVMLFSGNSTNAVVNQGIITGWNDDVILISNNVVNQQIINSANGVTAAAACTAVLFSPGSTP